jgi:hypothetical protein
MEYNGGLDRETFWKMLILKTKKKKAKNIKKDHRTVG